MLPFIIAHRGASHDQPENTLASFTLAWAQGADGIEGDFHLTADGQVVCIHDPNTRRVTGEKLIVPESNLAQLRQLNAGAYRGAARHTIPTVAEVLATIPAGGKFYLEIKCGSEIITPLLSELEKSAVTAGQITVISFDAAVIKALKNQAPGYRAYWLVDYTADRPGQPLPADAEVLQTLQTCRADGLGSSPGISPALAARILAQGYGWDVWTVDDIATAQQLQQQGVHSITTNTPDALRRGLT